MSWGLNIRNNNNEVQIDSGFRNFQIVAEGTTSTLLGTGLNYTFTVSFAAQPNPPLFFYRANPTSNGYINGVSSLTMSRDGSNNYSSIRLRPSDIYGTQGSWTMDWFVAAPANTASGDAWGLQVFDGAGAKVFDSGARYMRIGTVVELPANVFTLNYLVNNSDVNGEITFNHASVSNGFYCVNGVRSFRDQGTFVEIYSRRISDTQLKIGFLETETCPVLLSSYTSRPNHVIIGQRTL